MKYEELKRMKKKYPSFKNGKRTCLLDLALFDSLNEQEDATFAVILDNGYGKVGTIARLKVEFQRKVEAYSASAAEMTAVSFSDPLHTFCVEVESEKTYVYDQDTGKQVYVAIRPYAYRLTIFKNGSYEERPVYSEICGPWDTSPVVKEAYIERRTA